MLLLERVQSRETLAVLLHYVQTYPTHSLLYTHSLSTLLAHINGLADVFLYYTCLDVCVLFHSALLTYARNTPYTRTRRACSQPS